MNEPGLTGGQCVSVCGFWSHRVRHMLAGVYFATQSEEPIRKWLCSSLTPAAVGRIPVRPYNGEVRYGILADDLTGSCDAAGRLTRLGYRPLVVARSGTARRILSALPEEAAVVVMNTRSRDCSLREAVARARAAAEELERCGVPVIYQKIDSTLRGHWAEELKAVRAVTRPQHVLVCPAFPAQGRLVRDGRLHLRRAEREGLLHTTGAASAHSVRTILRQRCGWDTPEVRLESVRGGARAISQALEEHDGAPCVIFDATRERDLDTIGQAFRHSPARLLWVGSAGLVRTVLPPLPRAEAAPEAQSEGSWLLIQGSRQPLSHTQFQRLGVEPAIDLVDFSPGRERNQRRRWLNAALGTLSSGRDVAVAVPRAYDRRVPAEFVAFLDKLLLKILAAPRLGGIFVTGGNTAEAVCDSLRITTLRVTAEIRPGIARSRALDGRRPGLRLVTKAGGFGKADEVRQVLQRCRRA